ncbi:MAG: histidinol-phosphate transaminase [Lachnospiraceae bacterium]|nr:histidinol-phosphate transaminase [Lachnospiraceae bacterium]
MSNWRDNVRKVVPYVPGEQPNQPSMIKLNTNENPYPPSPEVQEALKQFPAERLRLYPDPTAAVLVNEIASYYKVKPAQVFAGVGSDDVLAMAFMTFFNSETPILFPDITYSFYDVWAEEFRIPYTRIPLDENFCIQPDDYKRKNGGIIFPNPNAPTGAELSQRAIEEILQENPDVVVIVDEAYVDFGAESALPLLEKYENLLVVQTYSKSRSMAGMRIGYCIGNEELISYLNDVKYSFNSYTMDQLTLATGVAAIRDDAYFKRTTGAIVETREWAKGEFRRLGFTFADSKANFVFVSHERKAAKEIYQALRERHIYVRYFNKERIDNYLRITIGTRDEMEALFAALKEILG